MRRSGIARWFVAAILLAAAHAVPAHAQRSGLTERDVRPPEIQIPAAPAGAPNVVVVLLDDVGFGAAATFGGPVPTPALDALARDGLRYNRFHTTGICSPTRASLLTGRNAHAANVGAVMNTATNHDGYQGILRESTATIATILKQRGYRTSAWGKWHLVPDWEVTPAGPFDRWPTGVGFEKFYGFLGGETDQFAPTLYEGTTPVVRRRGSDYHLTEDLADRAIEWMALQKAIDPERPFFVYFAPGATHAPLQAPQDWVDRFEGRFDRGWDRMRETIFARQKQLGVIPKDAMLTPRPAALPAWDSVAPDEKRVAARLMEVYAAFLAHTDVQVGRLVDALQAMGEYDDTLFFYIVGDNGGSGEGGLQGSANYMADIQGLSAGLDEMVRRIDELGGPASHPHYPAAWAWATNTPFQWMKTIASHLGATRNPMVVVWPARIRTKGELRSQLSHVNDIAPTILEAAGIAMPDEIGGVAQRPMDGTSLVYTFDDAMAPDRHRTQYFEILGNRSLVHDGWMASAFRGRLPWQNLVDFRFQEVDFAQDEWELYRLDEDFSQSRNLAATHPEKLRELQDLFWAEAARNDVLPLHRPSVHNQRKPSHAAGRTRFHYRAGAVGIAEREAPNTRNRSHSLTARIVVPDPQVGARGVIATMGGQNAGWSLYVNERGQPVYHYDLFDVEVLSLVGDEPLAPGEVALEYTFERMGDGPFAGGIARLHVNGREVARGRIVRTAPVFFTIDETFDVGVDTGSAAGPYESPFPFSGEVVDVTVDLK